MRKALLTGAACALAAATAAATGHNVYIHIGDRTTSYPWYSRVDGMRCQMLFDRESINSAGTITEFELEKMQSTGTYANVKFYLCHTPLAALTTNFAANYGGNTPKMVASFATYELPAVEGVYPIPMAETFDYDNEDNLILEITWERGAGQKVVLFAGVLSAHVCFAEDDEATTGAVEDMGFNARIFFDTYPGVAPTSFGRVKALYR